MAAVLGFEETVQQITAIVLNGGEDSFQTTPVEFDPESVDGKTNAVFYSNRSNGDMQSVN